MNKKIVITGANKGIGLALVQHYLSMGDQVYGVCRQTSEDLTHSGAHVIEMIDVADENSINALAKELAGVEIDILVNNAGILSNQTLDHMDYDKVMQQINVNALGPLRVTLALRKQLKPGSKVIMITSRMGSIADNTSGGYYGYRMSKTALNMAATSLAKDLQGEGVSVAIVHPGFVQTSMVGYGGDISASEAAKRIAARAENLTLENSGTFWHSNGDVLPW